MENIDECEYMTRAEMIDFIKKHPYKRVRHTSFCDDEYLYCGDDENVYDESGYLFENWLFGHNNGLQIRSGGNWENGWSLCDLADKSIKGGANG